MDESGTKREEIL